MGVLLALLFLMAWGAYERSVRRRLQLPPYSQAQLKEIFVRKPVDAEAKALKAAGFAAILLVAFSIWEGCLWAVLDKGFGWIGLGAGLVAAGGLFYLRYRAYADNARAARPFTLAHATFLVALLFFWNGPIVATIFGLWFLLRLQLLRAKKNRSSLA